MTRRMISLLLCCALCFSTCLLSNRSSAEAVDQAENVAAETETGKAEENSAPECLHVANPTPLTGHFFTSMWGASTSDLDVQELLHRYKLVVYDNEIGRYRMNHLVVTGAVTQDDEEGNRTYHIALYEDLYYSDGTHITAWDYAFTLLLLMDPAVKETGGTPAREEWIQGEEEYINGTAKTLSGIHIVNDYLFSVTVKKEYLPYFYELSRFRISPYPIHVIAPGYKVMDDGDGIYLSHKLTGELLRETVLDPDTGYMTAPKVNSGPYTLETYEDGVASFKLNTRYKGNQKGEIPSIHALTYGGEDGEEMIRKLESGELGLLNKVAKEETIQSALNLLREHPAQYRMTSYPRMGLTVIRFMPRSNKVQETAVRQAVFYCLDRDSIRQDYLGDFGLTVKGMYGVGQWMVMLLDGQTGYPLPEHAEDPTEEELLEYEQALAEWKSMDLAKIRDYTLDVQEAIRLLEENGWTLNRNGEPYQSGIRYKRMDDGELVGLELTVAIPENLREVLEKHWAGYMEAAGIGLVMKDTGIHDLAEIYRRNTAEGYDMVMVGEDFTDQFRLSGGYQQIEADEDPEEDMPLEALNKEMDRMSWEVYHTDKNDLKGFVRKWLDMQIELAESVPVIPVYSNVYLDFYRADLQDYKVENYLGWGNAIVASWIGEKTGTD